MQQGVMVLWLIAVAIFGIILTYMRKIDKEKLYIIGAFLCFALTNYWILAMDTHFFGYASDWDFGDITGFVNSYSQMNLYGSEYPPIALICYRLFKRFSILDLENDGKAIRYALTLFFLIAFSGIIVFIRKILEKKEVVHSDAMAICLLMSGPLLFAMERGNLIVYALLFTLIFIYYQESEKQYQRYFADFSLALAANLKFYPAIFGLVLIKKKQWKEAFVALTSGIMIYFLPALILKDISVLQFYKTFTGIEVSGDSLNSTLALKYACIRGLGKYGVNDTILKLFGNIAVILFLIVSIWVFFKAREQEQEYLMLTMIMIYIPGISFWYVVAFLIVPFLFYDFKARDITSNVKLIIYMSILYFVFGKGRLWFLYPGKGQFRIFFLWFFTIISFAYYQLTRKGESNE